MAALIALVYHLWKAINNAYCNAVVSVPSVIVREVQADVITRI